MRGDGDSNDATATTPATETNQAEPVLVAATVQDLRTYAAISERPIYWAGRRPEITYELTQTANGRIFIRYLPPGVEVGDRSGSYLIVGTYPVPDAFAAIEAAAEEEGAVTFEIDEGGLAVYNESSATNVYFAYPGTDYQVEVYDPDPEQARALVATGAVRPVR